MTTLAEDRAAAALALGDDAADRVAVHHDARAEGIEQHVDAGFGQHFERHRLHRFRLDEGDAHVQRAGPMLARAVCAPWQTVDEFLRQALDDLVALLAEEAQHRQADRHVAADEAAAFDQAHPQPVFGGGKGGGKAGRTAADDENVVLGETGVVRAGSWMERAVCSSLFISFDWTTRQFLAFMRH